MYSSELKVGLLVCASIWLTATSGIALAMNPGSDLLLHVEMQGDNTLTIELRNETDEPRRIWEESNSWGAARWHVVILRDDQTITLFQNPDQFFTKNNPRHQEIGPKSVLRKLIKLTDGSWLKVTKGSPDIVKGDVVVVLYDVPSSREAHEFNVWYGVTAGYLVVK